MQRLFHRLVRRAAWLAAARVLLALTVLVFAAPIIATQKNYQSQVGGLIQVANNLSATDKGFYVAASAASATSCAVPVTFLATPQNATTDIVAGHLIYYVQVNSTSSALLANTKFNATLFLSGTPYGPVCIQVATPLVGTIYCRFDIGSSTLPSSPYTFKLVIQ